MFIAAKGVEAKAAYCSWRRRGPTLLLLLLLLLYGSEIYILHALLYE